MSINWTNISKCVNFSMVGENKLKKRCAGVCVCVFVCVFVCVCVYVCVFWGRERERGGG